MDLSEAWRELGMRPTSSGEEVRRQYFAKLHQLHPDRSDAPDATDVTIRLTAAYRLVQADLRRAKSTKANRRVIPIKDDLVVPVSMVGDETIAIGATMGDTYGILLDAANRLGEPTHVEPGSGLLSVLVEFLHGPVCQLLLTLHSRARGITEIRCSVEPVGGDPAPPIDAVTRLVMSTMVAVRTGD